MDQTLIYCFILLLFQQLTQQVPSSPTIIDPRPGELQLLFTFFTIIGAGVSAYVGVKVAITEMRTTLKALDQRQSNDKLVFEQRQDRLEERIDRLESPFFQHK